MSSVVSTRDGRVAGCEERGLHVFRGIPYAASTAGPNRFRAPRPPASWSGVREATRPGSTAPQILGIMRDLPPQSEDCLHLNVWSPGLDRRRRPVLVFVHGGAFTTGASTNAMYDCGALAARGDLVVVTMNYRLGVLGFGYLGALDGFAADANNGLRDVIACLHWVRDNIESFGGDPENVTLMGQSAGAMIACTLPAVPAARGLFRRVIAQSGAAHHVTRPDQASAVTEIWLDALGVGAARAGRLRELPFETLIEAQAACFRRFIEVGRPEAPLRSPAMTLLPVIDGELLPQHPLRAAAQAAFPLLIGTNANEQNFWIFLSDPAKRELDGAALRKVIERRVPGHGPALVDDYARFLGDAGKQPWRIFSAIESDRLFRVPATQLAELRGGPSFLYAFDWCSPLFDGEMGCCHTLEVPFVLGQVDGAFGRVFAGGGPEALRLSERMMDAWIAFARSGDPSTEALGAWPAYRPPSRATMALCAQPRLAHAPAEARRARWDGMF